MAAGTVKISRRTGRPVRERTGRPPSICTDDEVLITNIRMPKKLLDWAKASEGFGRKVRRLLAEEYAKAHGHPAYPDPIR